MQTVVVIVPTVLVSVFFAFVLWEYLVKKGGGTVVLEEDSWLMRKWNALNPGKDPRNICEMFQVIWGHRRVGHQVLVAVEAMDSPHQGKRLAAKVGFSLLGLTLIVLAVGTLVVGAIYVPRMIQEEGALQATLIILIAFAIEGGVGAIVWFLTRPFVRGKIVSIWLGLCPPVQVKRATQESLAPANGKG